MSAYQPKPLDTSGVVLPAELEPLLERLAENTHEVWARARLDEGWTLGPKRDDAAKTHPCLVPYDALPETEKDYDRKVSRAVIEAILALGYAIKPAQ
ncbi:MAG: RyR domain-containing protein [Isosphaeraceae bacterium]|nr:RyR domain-containing protein [Isosphaeraceae bacterium]